MVFDPVSLGVAAATMVATKALEKFGSSVGEDAADGVSGLRDRLADWLRSDDDEVSTELAQVEAAPDSELSVKALAAAITDAAKADPNGAAKIAALVEELQPGSTTKGGATFNTQVTGDAKVGRIYQAGGDMSVTDSGATDIPDA